MMANRNNESLREVWDEMNEGDVSTELLLQLVAEVCNTSVGDVVEALYRTRRNDGPRCTGCTE